MSVIYSSINLVSQGALNLMECNCLILDILMTVKLLMCVQFR